MAKRLAKIQLIFTYASRVKPGRQVSMRIISSMARLR